VLVTLACAVIVRLKPLSSAVLLRSPDAGLDRGIFSHGESTLRPIYSHDKMGVFFSYITSSCVVNEPHVFTNL